MSQEIKEGLLVGLGVAIFGLIMAATFYAAGVLQ